jgi:pentose-5-phosphate-3-epimerase
VHLEAPHDSDVARVLAAVRQSGARAGLALKPGTPLAAPSRTSARSTCCW